MRRYLGRSVEIKIDLADRDRRQETAQKHDNFKRAVDWKHESGYRYVFHHPNDRNRELILTVLVFDIPKPK